MTTDTFDCVDCGAAVPRGRLSCPTCGALLAAVSGGTWGSSRSASFARTEMQPPGPIAADTDVIATSDALEAVRAAVAAHAAAAAALEADDPGGYDDVDDDAQDPLAPLLQPAPLVEDPDLLTVATAVSFIDDDFDAGSPDPAWGDVDPTAAHIGHAPDPAPSLVGQAPDPVDLAPPAPDPDDLASAAPQPGDPAPGATSDPGDLAPRAYEAAFWRAAVRVEDPVSQASVPAAYRPPSLAMATAGGAATAWPGVTTPGGSRAASPSDSGARRATPTSTATSATEAARYVEIGGWFVVVGAAMSLLGFLLPWSRTVSGARGFGGYFDTWGLASPTHLLIVSGLLAVLGLGVMRTRVPTWLATGVLGLVAGALLIGVAWPYLVGPLGADLGVRVVALGAIAMLIGGALVSWATRHVEVGADV